MRFNAVGVVLWWDILVREAGRAVHDESSRFREYPCALGFMRMLLRGPGAESWIVVQETSRCSF